MYNVTQRNTRQPLDNFSAYATHISSKVLKNQPYFLSVIRVCTRNKCIGSKSEQYKFFLI